MEKYQPRLGALASVENMRKLVNGKGSSFIIYRYAWAPKE